MDSEPNPDIVEAPDVPNETPPAPPKKKPGPQKREPAAPKRVPNEPITENWQRRMHVADHMDAPKLPAHIRSENAEDEKDKPSKEIDLNTAVIATENYTFAIGDHVFVDVCEETPKSEAANAMLNNWDDDLPAFRIGRIAKIISAEKLVVNWLIRPADVMRVTSDTREVYLSFGFTTIDLQKIRGKCVVQHAQEIRTMARFREKASQFWFTKFYDKKRAALYDVILTSSLKVLVGASKAETLGLASDYAIVQRDVATTITEASRSRRSAAAASMEAEDDSEMDRDVSPEDQEQLNLEKQYQPFQYWDQESKSWGSLPPVSVRKGKSYQINVDEWPGAPLVYYTYTTPTPRNPSKQVKLVEQDGLKEKEINLEDPWVQEMPSGYLSRGGDATSTPLSLPIPGIRDFVSRCQENYAQQLHIPKENLNFLDACCLAYTQGSQSREASVAAEDEDPSATSLTESSAASHNNVESRIESALLAVSRLSKRSIIPELSSEELQDFVKRMSPFQSRDWHSTYRAIASKPFQELCLFYWSQLPLQPKVPVSAMALRAIELKPASKLCCVECHTHQAPEWWPLPQALFITPHEDFKNKRLAICARCARLWFRYRTGWKSYSEVDPDKADSQKMEPELLEDANSYAAEQERRSKRRHAAAAKKEATAKKRSEEKEAKKEAKRLKKDKSSKPEDADNDVNGTESTVKADGSVEPSDNATKMTAAEKKLKEKAEKKKKAESAKQKKGKEGKKDLSDQLDDGSTTEESDTGSGPSRLKKRNGTALDTQLSLDLVDEILTSLDEELEPENSDKPKPCPVCGQLDPSMPQLTCASCFLSVHTACYGSNLASTHSAKSSDAWFCDCCLNSRGRLPYMLDVNYQCELCPPRSPEYSVWQTGLPTSTAPDVLKPTLNKTWCHLRCAIFNPVVTFADPSALQGINVLNLPKSPALHPCAICVETQDSKVTNTKTGERSASTDPANSLESSKAVSSKASSDVTAKPQDSGDTPLPIIRVMDTDQFRATGPPQTSGLPLSMMGSTVKCQYCDSYFHVACAADKQFFLGLQHNNAKAVIVCSKHITHGRKPSDFNLTPISKVDMSLNMTALQLFVTKHKISKQKHVSGQNRTSASVQREITRQKLGTSSLQQLLFDNGKIELIPTVLQCSRCKTENSSYWYRVSNEAVECSWCFRDLKNEGPDDSFVKYFWPQLYQRIGRFYKV